MTLPDAVTEEHAREPRATAALAPSDDARDESDRSMSLGRRLRSPQTLVSFGIAFALIFFLFRRLNIDFGEVRDTVRHANPWLLAVAFLAYYASFPIRAARWRRLLANASISETDGHAVPGVVGLSEIYILSWFANCVVPAKLGDAYRGYLLKKNAGPSFSRTLGTIFAERLLDVVALAVLMMLSGLIAFHGTVPDSLRWWYIAGGILAFVGVAGVLALALFSHKIVLLIPRRGREHYDRLQQGIVTSFSRGRFPAIVSCTLGVWILEGVRVFCVAHALGTGLSVQASIFVALLASLLTTFPVTPAGLGAVESGSILALKLFDIPDGTAAAIALIDRGIAYWSVILIGGVLYLVSQRK